MAILLTNSHPRVHTTGPVHFVIQIFAGANGTPATQYYYLGTCQTTPVVNIRKYRLNVMNDIGGRMVPFQKIEQGEDATINLLLNRFGRTAYYALLNLPQGAWNTTATGAESRFHRGQLSYGLHTFGLIEVYDFYGTNMPGTDQLISGRYWGNCELLGHDTPQEGTAEEHLMLSIKANPYWQATFGGSNDRGFNLYSVSSPLILDALAAIPAGAVAV